LKEQVKQGNLSGLRGYVSRTRNEREWQDRIFMLEEIVPSIRVADLDFACDVEPESADLFVIRCVQRCDAALTLRGTGLGSDVSEERWQAALDSTMDALSNLAKAVELDPDDPTGYTSVLRPLGMFEQLRPLLQKAFARVTELSPDLMPAHFRMVNAYSERWGGSHEESLQFARRAMSYANPANDMAGCLFWAHTLVQTHIKFFDKNPEEAARYFYDPDVMRELNAAFDDWVQTDYKPHRWSFPHLHRAACWSFATRDRERLRLALSVAKARFIPGPWGMLGKAKPTYTSALLFAGIPTNTPGMNDTAELCLSLMEQGWIAFSGGKLSSAEQAWINAYKIVRTKIGEEASHLIPLGLFCLSLLRQKQENGEDSQKFREEAKALLDDSMFEIESEKFQRLIANVLFSLAEYRLALPHVEAAIRLAGEDVDPAQMAAMLHKMGDCYSRVGLGDHAIVPLRAALKIYNTFPADPRLPSVLLTLGNALRRKFPVEAESCYRQSAEWRVARLQYDSATPAWVNLGIVCVQQGRYEEALGHYERVLRLREQNPGKLSRIASVLNSMANCYRQMGKFAEAHAHIDRAIRLASARDPILASAFNTRGLIFCDSGDDGQAVAWFRKGFENRMSQPSPNLASAQEDLESEIASLKRLGREDEVADAMKKLASIQSEVASAPEADGEIGLAREALKGAVFIELGSGMKLDAPRWRTNMNVLGAKLAKEVRTQDAGKYGGWVAVAENTTFIFYSRDAETLFKSIEPLLAGEPACAGAKVVLWQDGAHQEITLAGKARRLN